MKKSIRYQLLLYMLVSVLFFGIILFIANTFFAEKYYLAKKKTDLLTTSKEIIAIIQDLPNSGEDDKKLFDDNTKALLRMEKIQNQNIVIYSKDGTLFFPPPEIGVLTMPASTSLKQKEIYSIPDRATTYSVGSTFVFETISQIDPYSFFALAQDNYLNINTLQYQTTLENGLTLLISIPMNTISEGTAISNQFITMIGLITILVTIIWAFFISHKFTNPITQINQIASRMSHLDFSKTIVVKGQDELAQLSENINILSTTLDQTIRELNETNTELVKDIDKERQIDKMRREFISNVSHELKTPIFLIQGYADGLKTNITNHEDKKNFYCDVISEEASKMDHLVQDLLELARLESETLELKKTVFHMSDFVKNIVSKYEITAEEKGIIINMILPENCLVYADPSKMEQVMTNFINNALEHLNKKKQIKIHLKTNGDALLVTIFNTGTPLPDHALDKVWNSFYKMDPARTRSLGGAGLGLSIVKGILQSHNMPYGARNEEDGVSFWFKMELCHKIIQ